MSPEWMEIFRAYSAEDLAAKIVELRRQVDAFSGGGSGAKSFTKDLSALRDQLQAATRVQSERSSAAQTTGFGVMDFSQLRV